MKEPTFCYQLNRDNAGEDRGGDVEHVYTFMLGMALTEGAEGRTGGSAEGTKGSTEGPPCASEAALP